MSIRIVTDSSANLKNIDAKNFASVPLSVTVGEKNFTDNTELNIDEMMNALDSFKGKTSTACPGPNDWLTAFGEGDDIIITSITGTLSGSFNSAKLSAELYKEKYPEARTFVFDSLTTGPELELLTRKAIELRDAGKDFVEICEKLKAYKKHTKLSFALASIDNFARNGRVSATLAKLVSVLHIFIVGKASDKGDLEPMKKSRGRNNAIKDLINTITELGYKGGKLIITHTVAAQLAETVKTKILELFPSAEILFGENHGLCSYYAEKGSVLVGFEI